MKNSAKLLGWIPIYAIVLLGIILVTLSGNQMITTLAEGTPLPGRRCIIIDAGHGGEDGGATSCTGVLESNINLEIALKLDDLMHFLGYNTKMVRSSDISVYTHGNTIAARKASDLKERVRIVNETENALLVSIHQNYFQEAKYSGAQVFYSKTAGSEELAKIMQTNFVSSVNKGSKRKAKPASQVYLMDQIACTGILVECGFLSNPEEEAKLRSGDYQKKLCCVIAAAVGSFAS